MIDVIARPHHTYFKSHVFRMPMTAGIFSLLACGFALAANTPSKIIADVNAIAISGTVKFTLDNKSTTPGMWVVLGGVSNGQIDQNGVYKAPATLPQPNIVTVQYLQPAQTLQSKVTLLNPQPAITGFSPQQITSPITTLIVQGTNFARGAQLVVGGSVQNTTFVNSGTLSATVIFPAGTKTSLLVTVANPAPALAGMAKAVTVNVPSLSLSPAIIAPGPVQLYVTGLRNLNGLVMLLDGRTMWGSGGTSTSVGLGGFLPPWHTGQAVLQINSALTGQSIAQFTIPIQQTAVSFDAAARFLMQAGFGPRPDLVQHVQQIGFDAYIAEQQAMPVEPYQNSLSVAAIMGRSVLGNSQLRMRVAWALQSYLVRAGISRQETNAPFEVLMERDSTGNYRDLLTDISSDSSMAVELNIAPNPAPFSPGLHPNQNFARELLQLFSIGTVALNDDGTPQLNPDGSSVPAYDQSTILDLSRVLTGWNYAPSQHPDLTFYGVDWGTPLVGNPRQHDTDAKTVLGVTIPAGLTMEQDRKMALDIIFNHSNLPPFVSRILIQRLVKSNPSPAYVRRVSAVFQNDGTGVRGNMAAVVRAILLDQEARAGDTSPSAAEDGFLQEPYLFETFLMSITGWQGSDAQPSYLPCTLKECIFNSPTVFGFFSPSYHLPGTNITAPEFQIFDNITLVNRSQLLWKMVSNNLPGFGRDNNAWLYANFQTIPEFMDAVNHLAYHGQMSQQQQTLIANTAAQYSTNTVTAQQAALFLSLNSDSYSVVQ